MSVAERVPAVSYDSHKKATVVAIALTIAAAAKSAPVAAVGAVTLLAGILFWTLAARTAWGWLR